MSITPKKIRDLIAELDENRQSRLRAWEAL
jgi:hypothetical protein